MWNCFDFFVCLVLRILNFVCEKSESAIIFDLCVWLQTNKVLTLKSFISHVIQRIINNN